MTEIYVTNSRADEIVVQFDLGGPVHTLTRAGLCTAASQPLYAGDLIYTPTLREDEEEAREHDEQQREDDHQNALDDVRSEAVEEGREEGAAETRKRMQDVLYKIARTPEITALFVDGFAASEVLQDEIMTILDGAL